MGFGFTKEVAVAVQKWNHKKSWANFKAVYKHCFIVNGWRPWFGFRVWRIIRNTLIGRYKEMEQLGIQRGYINDIE